MAKAKREKEPKSDAAQRRTNASAVAAKVLRGYSGWSNDAWTLSPEREASIRAEVHAVNKNAVLDGLIFRVNAARESLFISIKETTSATDALSQLKAVSEAATALCGAWGAVNHNLKLTIKYQISQGIIAKHKPKSASEIIQGQEFYNSIKKVLDDELWRFIGELQPLATALNEYNGRKPPFATSFVLTLCSIWLELSGCVPAYINDKDRNPYHGEVKTTPFERFVSVASPPDCGITDHIVREAVDTFKRGTKRRKPGDISP